MRHTRQILITLGALRRDVLSAEALDGLADRHGVAAKDIVNAIDDMRSNASYNVEQQLEHEIEDEDPV